MKINMDIAAIFAAGMGWSLMLHADPAIQQEFLGDLTSMTVVVQVLNVERPCDYLDYSYLICFPPIINSI